jgi:hypothetical protein
MGADQIGTVRSMVPTVKQITPVVFDIVSSLWFSIDIAPARFNPKPPNGRLLRQSSSDNVQRIFLWRAALKRFPQFPPERIAIPIRKFDAA